MEVTRAEVCVVACSDLWRGAGEVLAHPVGTIPTISARLAQATHSPELVLTDGGPHLMSSLPPMGAPATEGGAIEGWMPFRSVFDVVATGRRRSLMGASQIDAHGNQNISAIGDWRRPHRQLVGVRGAPGNTVEHRCDYWVPRHSSRVFVEAVDIVSGVGNDRARAAGSRNMPFHDLGAVVTNLAVLDYDGEGRLRVRSLHPGVTAEEVQESTGFAIDATTSEQTRLPDAEELRLIREVLDPRSLRDREVPTNSR